MFVFFFKQKTAYEMRISDWSSDVCSSDLFPSHDMGKGQEKTNKNNKQKLTTKEKQEKKKQKKEGKK